jgi:hypothetical protein
VSLCRQQALIEAPVEVVWELLADVNHHPEWWPRVVGVACEGLDEGCAYKEVVKTPLGVDELDLLIEDRDELRKLNIRCLSTGTFVRFGLTEARGGTFVEGEMGMDPHGLGSRVFDAVAGRRYFATWIVQTFESLQAAARDRTPA